MGRYTEKSLNILEIGEPFALSTANFLSIVFHQLHTVFEQKCTLISLNNLIQDESLMTLQRQSKQIKDAYQHLFDLVIVNNDIDETIKVVEVSATIYLPKTAMPSTNWKIVWSSTRVPNWPTPYERWETSESKVFIKGLKLIFNYRNYLSLSHVLI